MTEAAPRRLKFGLIEAGRGLASLMVVFHHTGNMMAEPRRYGIDPFGGIFRNFHVGVDFFFVLSGFIITWVHWRDLGEGTRLGGYARKRFLRLYPAYWGVVFPLIAFYLLRPAAGAPSQHAPANMLLSILLLPYPGGQPILGVAWTLTHEVLFYILFGLLIAAGRSLMLPLFAGWAAAILIAQAFAPPFPLSFVLSPYNLEFIMGVGAAALLRRGEVPGARVLLAGGAAAFVALTLAWPAIMDVPIAARLLLGGAATAFVLGAVEHERRRPVRVPRALLFLGAISYVLYLVHTQILAAAVPLAVRHLPAALPLDMVALLLAAVAVAAGILYHLVAEPLLTGTVRRALDLAGWRRAPAATMEDAR